MEKKRSQCWRIGLFEAPHGSGTTCLFMLLFFWKLSSMATAQSGSDHPTPGFDPDHLHQPFKFNTSMAIFLIVVATVFFCFGCTCVYIRHCAERGVLDPVAPVEYHGFYVQPSPPPGLDPTILKKFPTFQYSTIKGLKIRKRALECAICLQEFEDHEMLRFLPQCNHVFHPQCIDSWLSSRTTCPICRANLVPKPEESYQVPVTTLDASSSSHGAESREFDSDQTEHQASINVNDDQESPNLGILSTYLPMPWPVASRNNRSFSRCHSTGHSLVQVGGDRERFTLRLPKDVRNQLLNTSLKLTKSCKVPFALMRSPTKGFLSRGARNCYQLRGVQPGHHPL